MKAAREEGSLTRAQKASFLRNGYVALRGCFSARTAAPFLRRAYERLGYYPDDPASWRQEKCCLAGETGVMVRDFAPRAWAATLQLLGGPARLRQIDSLSWSDSFVIKFKMADPGAWRAPDRELGGWHKDGPDAPHRLDSAETGLIHYVYWSDVGPRGGGTFLACDSIAPVARLLAARPAGVRKEDPAWAGIIQGCRRFVELTGKAGDVFLVHPYMLHSESGNASRKPRFFTVRMVEMAEPLCFDRPKEDYSLVERAALRGLGVRRFSFGRGRPQA